MSSLSMSLICFACIFGSALVGMWVRSLLPEHHLAQETKDIVKLGSGLIATLTALVLGLLVSSAKGTLDSMDTELTQDGARAILLDRVLANYGPETNEVRGMLRYNLVTAIKLIWPDDKAGHAQMRTIEASTGVEKIQGKLRELSPRNDTQRQLLAQALQISNDLAQSRWLLIEHTQHTLPKPFLVVLLFWLAVLFASFGVTAPKNGTVIVVFLVSALSVAGAIFLILEMYSPLDGIIKVSSAPLQKALSSLGR